VAYTDPTDAISAGLTNAGRDAMARLIMGELAFRLSSFQVGMGGYDPGNPVRITPLNLTLTDLLTPVGGKRDFITIEQPIGPNVVAPITRLEQNDATVEFGLGELGIYGTYEMHLTTPALVGTDFLFAAAHFPLVSKIPSHTFVWRIIIAL